MTETGGLPLIVDIKRHSLEDGPGIRSVVFFKGCPLRCVFCHSPETQILGPEIGFFRENCIESEACVDTCPEGSIQTGWDDRINRARCTSCGICASACPGQGLRLIGKLYPVEELAEILLRDRIFYRHSGGGVTLSGGECTLYPDYLESLLERLKQEGTHLVLETCGHFDYEKFSRKILPFLDLVYFDVKFADPDLHRTHTGRSNRKILANLRRLLKEAQVQVHPRIPLIPGMTATFENLSAIAGLLNEAGADDIALLPYNPMGVGMAVSLGRTRPSLPETFMSPAAEREIRQMFTNIVEAEKAKQTSAKAS